MPKLQSLVALCIVSATELGTKCTDTPIFEANCADNFHASISVELNCLAYFYPHIQVTSLQLLAEPDIACPVAATPDAAESMWGDYNHTVAVTDETSELFFSRGCFSSPVESDGILQFKTLLSTTQPEPSVITSIPRFTEYEIQCKYQLDGKPITLTQDVTVPDPDDEKVKILNQEDNDAIQQVQSDLANVTLENDSGEATKSLGDWMTVDYKDIAGLTNFYVKSVIAMNDAEAESDDYRSLTLVKDGCLNADIDENNEPWKSIAPQLSNGKRISFHQFGFRKASGETSELYFKMESKLKFGSKPDCSQTAPGRRFRDPETTVSFGYTIENTDNITFTDDGLALGPKSTKKNITITATTTAAASTSADLTKELTDSESGDLIESPESQVNSDQKTSETNGMKELILTPLLILAVISFF